jgi:hypothetical protein
MLPQFISEPSRARKLLDRQPLASGPRPFRINTENVKRASVQWVNHVAAGGASATVAFFAAATPRTDDLANTDPAANPFWSPIRDETGTPVTFAVLPGATIGSDILPLNDLAVTELLVVFTVTGAYTEFSIIERTAG